MKSYNAGIITALTNRIGDVIILIAIAIIRTIGSFNLLNYPYENSGFIIQVCIILLIIAACTKSAQIPFSAWLPAAMAAPTPVSALVHSSTLVTAGVYMLIRFSNPIISIGLTKYLLIISILTILIAGIGANLETDLKKVIALSTLSQLGLIIIAVSINIPKLAYFHMLSHALFKALLFMCAGNIIHGRLDNQDIRKIGNIIIYMPVTAACLNTANLALCGVPFIAGFYSKDIILECMLFNSYSNYTLFLVYFATALTVIYSLRLRYYSIASTVRNASLFNLSDISKFSRPATTPLTIMSIIGGAIIRWTALPTPAAVYFSTQIKCLILIILTLGAILRVCLIRNSSSIVPNNILRNSVNMIGSMWYLPTLSTRVYGFGFFTLGHFITYVVDRGWTEFTSIKWITDKFTNSRSYLQNIQNTSIKIHVITFIVWFIATMFIFMLYSSSLI